MQITNPKLMLCTLLLCLFAATTIRAQIQGGSYIVKGVLIDSLLNESQPYATIRIHFIIKLNNQTTMQITNPKLMLCTLLLCLFAATTIRAQIQGGSYIVK